VLELELATALLATTLELATTELVGVTGDVDDPPPLPQLTKIVLRVKRLRCCAILQFRIESFRL
jgi:hypothetical protein